MTRRAWPPAGPAPVLAAVLALPLLLGGCTVSTDSPGRSDRTTELVEQWQSTQRVELDLTTPLDREAAGFPDGQDSVPLERRPPEHLDVALRLPDGERLDIPAISMTLAATSTSEPDRIAVAQLEPFAAGIEVAERRVEQLGLDRTLFDAFLRDVAVGGDLVSGDVNRSVGEAEIGYLRVSLELRSNEADGTLLLNHLITWDVPAGGGA